MFLCSAAKLSCDTGAVYQFNQWLNDTHFPRSSVPDPNQMPNTAKGPKSDGLQPTSNDLPLIAMASNLLAMASTLVAHLCHYL